MHLTKIIKPRRRRVTVSAFGGIDVRPGAPADRWGKTENVTSDRAPAAASRPPRRAVTLPGTGPVTAVVPHGDSVAAVRGTGVVVDGVFRDLGLTEGEKTVVPMGSSLIVFPDGVYYDAVSGETGAVNDEAVFTTGENGDGNVSSVYVCLSDRDGGTLSYSRSVAPPADPENGSFWYDVGSTPNAMRQYRGDTGTWEEFDVCQKYIFDRAVDVPFAPGDTVKMTYDVWHTQGGDRAVLPRGTVKIAAVGERYFAVPGGYANAVFDGFTITLSRAVPRMDFVTEAGNRLWGCRYGENADGVPVNEIYASALGDFRNFNVFEGVSTDSYAASVGVDGPFTGAASFDGSPVFFKENAVIRVRGSVPSVFRVTATAAEGVEAGSSRSVASLGGRLYYKARRGIMRYDGVSAELVSAPLGGGYSEASGGAGGGKYRVSMKKDGEFSHFVFDPGRSVWLREDSLRVLSVADAAGGVWLAAGDGGLLTAEGGDGTVRWFFETVPLGADGCSRTFVDSVSVRLRLAPLSRAAVLISFDGGEFVRAAAVTGAGDAPVAVPVKVRRCDRFRIRVEGEGEGEILSLSMTVGEGSRRG